MNKIKTWLKVNKLTLNFKKTKYMLQTVIPDLNYCPSAEPLIPSSKNNKSEIENAWVFKVCNQTDNLETDSKTIYYRLLKLKMQSFYIFKAQKRLKQICIFKQQPQKSHGMDILP